jgi:hypothetical protein
LASSDLLLLGYGEVLQQAANWDDFFEAVEPCSCSLNSLKTFSLNNSVGDGMSALVLPWHDGSG